MRERKRREEIRGFHVIHLVRQPSVLLSFAKKEIEKAEREKRKNRQEASTSIEFARVGTYVA